VDKSGASASASASASAALLNVARGIPVPPEEIQKAVNPDKMPLYSGPTGSVHGVITIRGDEAPELDWLVAKIPEKCSRARTVYERLFREGMMRSLADVLVTVTGYRGYVAPTTDAVRVEARGCAWDRRTIAVTFGQRIDVISGDGQSYVPELLGARMPAEMFAIPKGDAVRLYPNKVGRFLLSDGGKPFMFADVFVLKYPTTAVTGLDGRYDISRIPAGKVTVTALLPATLVTSSQTVEIVAGKDLELNLEIGYDKSKYPSKLPEALKKRAEAALPASRAKTGAVGPQ
jgi:hypothetical protein